MALPMEIVLHLIFPLLFQCTLLTAIQHFHFNVKLQFSSHLFLSYSSECNQLHTHIAYIITYILSTIIIYTIITYVQCIFFSFSLLILTLCFSCTASYSFRIFWFALVGLMGNSASLYSHKYISLTSVVPKETFLL